jgi:chromosome segregation ATPase
MARVIGKDVLVELLDVVEQLKASQKRQDEDIERIVTRLGLMAERSNETVARMDSMTARIDALTARMNEMTARMNEMTARMNEMTARMNELSAEMASLREHFRELAEDQLGLRQDFVSLAQHGRQMQAGLQRLSAILVKALDVTDERFDELEARIAALEKKTG